MPSHNEVLFLPKRLPAHGKHTINLPSFSETARVKCVISALLVPAQTHAAAEPENNMSVCEEVCHYSSRRSGLRLSPGER